MHCAFNRKLETLPRPAGTQGCSPPSPSSPVSASLACCSVGSSTYCPPRSHIPANVGPPVTPDITLVRHPTQRDPMELPAQASGHGLGDAGLAHSRGAGQAQNGATQGGVQLPRHQVIKILQVLQVFQLPHCQVLQYSLFNAV